MTQAAFDACRFKKEQQKNWDSLAESWLKWTDIFEEGAAVVTDQLLNVAGIFPGASVLDIATGVGEPALTAARVVGTSGTVVALEHSAAMLVAAEKRGAGFQNLRFVHGDAEQLDFPSASFDAVLCRWGLMFLPDIRATLQKIRTVLKPSGVFSASVWGAPERVPMLSLGFGIVAKVLCLPPPPKGTPTPFCLCNFKMLGELMLDAGFAQVSSKTVLADFRLLDADRYVEFAFDTLPAPVKQMLAESPELIPEIHDSIVSEASRFRTADGQVRLPSESLCISATR